MSNDDAKPPYEVGYKKPPKRTQFQSGQSGNAKGRPRGAKSLTTIVTNAITEKVKVTENGKRKSVSKLEVAIKQLVNKAASGDPKAITQLLPLVHLIEGRVEAAAAIAAPALAAADHQVMASIRTRLLRQASQDTTISKPTDTTLTDKEEDHA